MNGMVIKQLEKALECKDDKELRLRVEVLLDILKEQPERPFVPSTPSTPIPTYYDTTTPGLQPPYKATSSTKKKKQVQGPGAIMSSNGEQLIYTRPAGT